jgi:hypothetical protein
MSWIQDRQFENRSALYLLSVCRAGSEVDDLGIMHDLNYVRSSSRVRAISITLTFRVYCGLLGQFPSSRGPLPLLTRPASSSPSECQSVLTSQGRQTAVSLPYNPVSDCILSPPSGEQTKTKQNLQIYIARRPSLYHLVAILASFH